MLWTGTATGLACHDTMAPRPHLMNEAGVCFAMLQESAFWLEVRLPNMGAKKGTIQRRGRNKEAGTTCRSTLMSCAAGVIELGLAQLPMRKTPLGLTKAASSRATMPPNAAP